VGVVACGLVVVVAGCVVVDVEVLDGSSSTLSSREPDPVEEEPDEDGSLTEEAMAPAGSAASSDTAHKAPPASRSRGAQRARSRGHVRLSCGMSRAQSCCNPCDRSGYGVWRPQNVPLRPPAFLSAAKHDAVKDS